MPDLNGNVPDLSMPSKVKAGVALSAFVRRLDHDGTAELKLVQTSQEPQAVPSRFQLVDAEELVEMIREVVQHELRRFLDLARLAEMEPPASG